MRRSPLTRRENWRHKLEREDLPWDVEVEPSSVEANYALCGAIRACHKCAAMVSQRQLDGSYAVPAEVGSGYQLGGVAVICEAPGAQEAASSRPLVGPAGRIFNELLVDAGLSRDELVLMNRVRCRPPGNRLASVPEALINCDEWLVKELNAYNPGVVVVMGGTALSVIFGATAKVGATRGASRTTGIEFPYGPRIWVATYHPASLLPNRSPGNRGLVVQDLALARRTWETAGRGSGS